MHWVSKSTFDYIYDFDSIDDKTKKDMLKSICKDSISSKKFDWQDYNLLVKLLPYVDCLTNKQREKFMQIFSGDLLVKLDYEDNCVLVYDLESSDIPFLFELKNVVATLWSEGYECKFMIKTLDRKIIKILKRKKRYNFEYIEMFFSELEYPYTKESLKRCKNKILKKNHPDNGGSGDYINAVQAIYKQFLRYIDTSKIEQKRGTDTSNNDSTEVKLIE